MVFALSKMNVSSPAFKFGESIPAKHSGEGENVSPPLEWSGAPAGTRSFVVACHDPDAPLVSSGSYGFVHWVLYDIPATVNSVDEGTTAHTPGRTDGGDTGYTGPMPPTGHGTHHYFFSVMALDTGELKAEPGLSLWELLERIEPNVIGMNRLVGTYRRG